MSATVVFNNTTIWSEAGTGIGRVNCERTVPTTRWAFEELPRGNGMVAKDLGTTPARVVCSMEYALGSSAISGLEATLGAFRGVAGTLEVPPGQSYGTCVLVAVVVARGNPMQTTAGSIVYRVAARLEFQQLKA